MRFTAKIFLATATALLLASGMAWAAGDVLLPNDAADKNSPPNLGLMPSEAAPADTTPTMLPTPPVAPAKPAVAPVATPTQIQAAPPVAIVPPGFSLTAFLAKPIYWNANDLNIINAQLGLHKEDVNRLCGLGFNGMLVTNVGSYNFDSQMAGAARITFQGYVVKTIVNLYALCTMPPKPGFLGMFQRDTKTYSVPLNGTACEPPRTDVTLHNIMVTHRQDGQDICAFTP